jgi:hypothetical protein
MFPFELPDHSTSVFISVISVRLLGKAFRITGHKMSVHSNIPFSFAVIFWVNGRRTSTIIMIHDILHKIAIFFFSISSFLQSVGLTITLIFQDPRLPSTRIQQTRSAASLSTQSILRNLNLRLVQMVPQEQKLSNASVQRATRVKTNIMW